MSESPSWLLGLSPYVSAGLIQAYDRVLPADALAIEHPDPPFAAWLVKRGRVTVEFKGGKEAGSTLVARENQWLILPAQPRVHRMTPGTHLLSVRMLLEHSPGIALFSARKPLRLPERSVPHLHALAAKLVEVSPREYLGDFSSRADDGPGLQHALLAEVAWRGAFLAWIDAYLRIVLAHGWRLARQIAPASPVEKVLGWIRQQGFASPLRQADMAEISGLSLSHLKRRFQQEVALSPIAYWQNQRQEKARHLLRETRLPLKEIAGELGFRFPSHFSIWFRNRSGMSPLEFRRRQVVDV